MESLPENAAQQSLSWYRQAAHQGSAVAMLPSGKCYEESEECTTILHTTVLIVSLEQKETECKHR